MNDAWTTSEYAGGVLLSGHLDMLERDKLVFSTLYGKGLGRYLLGIQSAAGSTINTATNDLDLRTNWGAMIAYKHQWNNDLGSTVMGGHARADSFGWQPSDTFESSTYGAINLMWSVQAFMTVGIEYGYGVSDFKGGNDLDNHRISLGMQIY